MVSCTKGAKYALCALHDNGAGIRCRLQLQHAGNISIIVARRSSLQLDSIKASSARSCVSFEAHEKLSVSALKAEPSTDCSAAYSSSNERGVRSGRSVLSVAQWRHVSLGQGIKIIANSPVPSSPWAAACKCQSQKVKVPSHRQQQQDAPEKCNKHSKYAKKDSTKRGNQAIRLRQSKKRLLNYIIEMEMEIEML